ncbi:Signal transduction histidine-protein kinase/phosphatase DegS [compost metagenome]
MVKIVVQDNGLGFKVDQLEKKTKEHTHFGLIGMRERVELLEGRMEIESTANLGTKVIIHIPTNAEKRKEYQDG